MADILATVSKSAEISFQKVYYLELLVQFKPRIYSVCCVERESILQCVELEYILRWML